MSFGNQTSHFSVVTFIKNWRWLSFVLLSLCYSVQGQAENQTHQCIPSEEPLEVWYFRPDGNNSFWYASERFAKKVAKDLGISLTVYKTVVGDDNRLGFKRLVDETFSKNKGALPDFLITILYGGGEFAQLENFEQYGVPFLSVNTSLDEKVLGLTGEPRERFAHWKGHMSPDEKRSGAQLVTSLAEALKGRTLGIIAGANQSKVNQHRVEGALEQARKLRLSVVPPMYTDWTRESGANALRRLLQRVPDIDYLWTAGSDITLGVMDVLNENDGQFVMGSFDWSDSNIRFVRQKKLQVALGGHFMEPGLALVMAYDFLTGIDFIADTGAIIKTELGQLDLSNVDTISPQSGDINWQSLDFKHHSKCHNVSLEHYQFDLTLRQ